MEAEKKTKKILKNSSVLVSGISTSLAILINVKNCFDRTLLASLAQHLLCNSSLDRAMCHVPYPVIWSRRLLMGSELVTNIRCSSHCEHSSTVLRFKPKTHNLDWTLI